MDSTRDQDTVLRVPLSRSSILTSLASGRTPGPSRKRLTKIAVPPGFSQLPQSHGSLAAGYRCDLPGCCLCELWITVQNVKGSWIWLIHCCACSSTSGVSVPLVSSSEQSSQFASLFKMPLDIAVCEDFAGSQTPSKTLLNGTGLCACLCSRLTCLCHAVDDMKCSFCR